MRPLTLRQERVLIYIKRHILMYDNFPTMKQIGEHFGISRNGAQGYVNILVHKGYVEKKEGNYRLIKKERK